VNQAANGCALDFMCHTAVESFRTEAYADGWLLRDGQIPENERVLRRGVFVLLRDSGAILPAPPTVLHEVSK
jgi:5-methylcytosine-specific restriction enzyme A